MSSPKQSSPQPSSRPANNRSGTINTLAAFCTIVGTIIGTSYFLYDRYSPKTPPIDQLFTQAQQAYHEHDLPSAIDKAKQVVQQQETHTDAHKLLASCYAQDGNPQHLQGAANEYQRAMQLAPDDMETELTLAALLDKMGRRAEARDAYRIVVSHVKTGAKHDIAAEQLRGL